MNLQNLDHIPLVIFNLPKDNFELDTDKKIDDSNMIDSTF